MNLDIDRGFKSLTFVRRNSSFGEIQVFLYPTKRGNLCRPNRICQQLRVSYVGVRGTSFWGLSLSTKTDRKTYKSLTEPLQSDDGRRSLTSWSFADYIDTSQQTWRRTRSRFSPLDFLVRHTQTKSFTLFCVIRDRKPTKELCSFVSILPQKPQVFSFSFSTSA